MDSQVICKGPSINNVSFEKEGGACQKCHFEAIFRAKIEATGGGRGSRNPELEETSFITVTGGPSESFKAVGSD